MAARSTLVREDVKALSTEVVSGAKVLGGATAALWGVELVNALLFGGSLVQYGVVPRTIAGLSGILFAPFLHAGFVHLALNTVPLWILGAMAMARKQLDFWVVAIVGAVTSGLGAWLFGAPGSVHVGASGVIFALFGFLLARGVFERTLGTLALSAGTFWFFGAMLMGMIPGWFAGVSWQSHLFGFIGGVAVASVLGSARRAKVAGRRR